MASLSLKNRRIGIITYHRANNFGAVLQCYALQETLSRLGYFSFVIDYRQPYTELIYNPVRLDIVKQGLLKPRLLGGYLFKVFPERFKRAKQYNKFRDKYLRCTQPVHDAQSIPQDVDVYLIGSDQMWGLHCSGYKVDPIYFGEFPHPEQSKVCGYAISSNLYSLSKIGRVDLSEYVRNFHTLSFREKTVRDEVKRLTNIEGRVDIDPSLLLSADDWNQLDLSSSFIKKGKYLLTYFLHEGSDNLHLKSIVEAYARRIDCKVIDMFDIAFSPLTFLSAIKNATCVLATSFHAIAFSIIFKKQFYALKTTDGKDIRYANLLNVLGIPQRLIDLDELLIIGDFPIDYQNVYERLSYLKTESIGYLEKL
ncbi:polysaccharide pyruvyl transferase family protein [uncultured Coprobacter sp.]|jgi:hypothetical protein|uniref:polysaccharide pyruvyl transferase family protein n=1 Tax=uncultured Coprobacter sp. TaxID=1720550 RepID=UPI002599EE79|nr:polysaccharide pyruvyl transferase family protein [uncultured Coprobacter sp.]